MSQAKDLTGCRFGRLLVERFSYRDPATRNRYWLCRCDCGREKIISQFSVEKLTRSCGCISKEVLRRRITTHGMSGSRTYRSWQSMIHRMTYPKHHDYEFYSKLGMDQRWLKFENFFSDMGSSPSPKHTLDRRDNNKGYWKNNCRWATWSQQMHNRGLFKNNASGFTGVYKKRGTSRWCATVGHQGKQIHVGYFESPRKAYEARMVKLKEIGI